MTNRQQSVFFLLIVFLFTAGAGLLVYRQYDLYYQEKTANDLEAAANLPVQKAPAPTVLADGRLQVDSPKEGDMVGQTFTVSGYAQGWFEGNIAIKVFDDNNKSLYQGIAIAGDNYDHPALFTSSIALTATSTTPAGKIEFNDYSAKDGSLIYQKIVKVKFWNTYKNDEYGFDISFPSSWIQCSPGDVDIPIFMGNSDSYYPANNIWGIKHSNACTNLGIDAVDLAELPEVQNDYPTYQALKNAFKDFAIAQTTIGSEPALRIMDCGGVTCQTPVINYYFFHNGKLFGISFFLMGASDLSKEEQQILSTFKFTK